jgi:hypothetical protein
MCSNPANKQMHLLCSENIFADHPVIIPGNIKNDPVTAFTQKISSVISLFHIRLVVPILQALVFLSNLPARFCFSGVGVRNLLNFAF